VEIEKHRGVGTGEGKETKTPKFLEDTKSALFSGGKVPFAFVKNVVQIAFLTHGCCKANNEK
jgi:hypothetical protein